MDRFRYELIGDKTTIRQLNLLGNVFSRTIMMKVLSRAAGIFTRQIRRNLAGNRRTGNLHQAVGTIRGGKNYSPALMVVVKMGRKWAHDGWYGYFLEKGTYKMKATHFFENAINAKASAVQAKINELLKRELDKFIKKNR